MTTGSWTVGGGLNRSFYAYKSWNGGNGKTEPWSGGIRDKWNNYTLQHGKFSQIPQSDFREWSALPPLITTAGCRAAVGWSNNDDLRALEKLAEAIRGHSFDGGINIAEAHKTYGTLVSNVQSVGSALLYLKHGKLKAALRVLGSGRQQPRGGGIRRLNAKDLSGRWLEAQYAFMPLISQSYEAGQALQALTRLREKRFNARIATKRKVNQRSDLGPFIFEEAYSYSKQYTAELYEDMSVGRSLGLTNPAAIVWELVPYSFVVDWFLPIGSYLSVLGQIPKLNGRFLTTERGGWKLGRLVSGDKNWIASLRKANGRAESFAMSRTVSASLSVPRPTVRAIPEALSPRRILSAISLIHQRLR